MKWSSPKEPMPKNKEVFEVLIRHCNKELNLPDEIITGYWGDDNLYLEEGGELSFNWDVVGWRQI